MEKLEDSGDLRDVSDMRLVTKAWHTAFKEYPTDYDFGADEASLEQLLAIKPNLSKLELMNTRQHKVQLGLLTAASSLTSLHITGNTWTDIANQALQPLVKLNKLPPSLQVLNLDSVYIHPAYVSKLVCTNLTDLSFSGQQNNGNNVVELLTHLPKLEVPICTDEQSPTAYFLLCAE